MAHRVSGRDGFSSMAAPSQVVMEHPQTDHLDLQYQSFFPAPSEFSSKPSSSVEPKIGSSSLERHCSNSSTIGMNGCLNQPASLPFHFFDVSVGMLHVTSGKRAEGSMNHRDLQTMSREDLEEELRYLRDAN
eukprot:TRINITY_DN9747_c0_g1_i1.p1 TRINITY_DN9747_c0_g1~~TRINITY_DN9747_c0_g1_i1.p1  ORF type:complete len:154 (+),score=34.76 TRINITY_DN9747_c0_g1_i1:69-464(+)